MAGVYLVSYKWSCKKRIEQWAVSTLICWCRFSKQLLHGWNDTSKSWFHSEAFNSSYFDRAAVYRFGSGLILSVMKVTVMRGNYLWRLGRENLTLWKEILSSSARPWIVPVQCDRHRMLESISRVMINLTWEWVSNSS